MIADFKYLKTAITRGRRASVLPAAEDRMLNSGTCSNAGLDCIFKQRKEKKRKTLLTVRSTGEWSQMPRECPLFGGFQAEAEWTTEMS